MGLPELRAALLREGVRQEGAASGAGRTRLATAQSVERNQMEMTLVALALMLAASIAIVGGSNWE